ncbi:hypothetical protein V6N00_15475 [Tersicoccus sp. MR15.9]|uniref:hypothetical protein n=1 Tax=Tersicoccus mangrovi TaxID=3121635 RepID=UPI002FE57EAC
MSTDRERAPGTRRLLGRRARHLTLIAHLTTMGAWIGVDAALVVLAVTSVVTGDRGVAGLCLAVLPLLLWPMAVAGLLTLATGLVLGWGTRYGVLRHWWVVVKLAITLVYLTLIPVGLTPTVLDRARLGHELLDGRATEAALRQLVFPAVVGPVLLVTAVVLAVVKPWGRVRRG